MINSFVCACFLYTPLLIWRRQQFVNVGMFLSYSKKKIMIFPLNLDVTHGTESSRLYQNLLTTDVTEQTPVNSSMLINETNAFNSTDIPHESTLFENESLTMTHVTTPHVFTATLHENTALTQSVDQSTPLLNTPKTLCLT